MRTDHEAPGFFKLRHTIGIKCLTRPVISTVLLCFEVLGNFWIFFSVWVTLVKLGTDFGEIFQKEDHPYQRRENKGSKWQKTA